MKTQQFADAAMSRPDTASGLPNYRMLDRTSHADFGIRSESTALPNPAPHRHEYFQIHVQLAGTTRHFLSGTNRPVQAGTICFVLPYKTHFIPTVAGSRYYILNASQGFLFPSLDVDMLDLEDVPIGRAPELAPFQFQEYADFSLPDGKMDIARSLCEAIAQENTNRSIASMILIRGYLLQLIALVWQQHGTALQSLATERSAGVSGQRTFRRLMSYVRGHMDCPISLADAAAAVHRSPSYVARLVKRETGQTFTELLNERRIGLAKELLIHTDLSIKEIAFRAGFSDLTYFARRFRALERCSPSEARARLRALSI